MCFLRQQEIGNNEIYIPLCLLLSAVQQQCLDMLQQDLTCSVTLGELNLLQELIGSVVDRVDDLVCQEVTRKNKIKIEMLLSLGLTINSEKIIKHLQNILQKNTQPNFQHDILSKESEERGFVNFIIEKMNKNSHLPDVCKLVSLYKKAPDVCSIFIENMLRLKNQVTKDQDGNTALDLAIQENEPKLVELLLQNSLEFNLDGAIIKIKNNLSGNEPEKAKQVARHVFLQLAKDESQVDRLQSELQKQHFQFMFTEFVLCMVFVYGLKKSFDAQSKTLEEVNITDLGSNKLVGAE